MTIGNKPKRGVAFIEEKLYWELSIGRNAEPSMYFEGGWRAFVFWIARYNQSDNIKGGTIPYKMRIRFAFWFPFYLL